MTVLPQIQICSGLFETSDFFESCPLIKQVTWEREWGAAWVLFLD